MANKASGLDVRADEAVLVRGRKKGAAFQVTGCELLARDGRRLGNGDPLGATGTAVWRTTATTCLGFGSLLTVSTPAIASLGGIVLGGVLCCFVASVVVLPALLEKPSAQ